MAIAPRAYNHDLNAREQGARRGRDFGLRGEFDARLLHLSRACNAHLRLLWLQTNLGQCVVRDPARERPVAQRALIVGRNQSCARCGDQSRGKNRRRDQYLNQAEAASP